LSGADGDCWLVRRGSRVAACGWVRSVWPWASCSWLVAQWGRGVRVLSPGHRSTL
jgi:hypothetical protein